MDYINLNLLPIKLDEDIEFPKSFYENTDILNMTGFHVTGVIKYNLSEEVEMNLHVVGNVHLKDAITLEDIIYPIDLKINENLSDLEGESEKFFEKSKNTLDKLEFLWENIVLEVPISVTNNSGVTLSGNGWELNKSNNEENIDPRFAKLNDLFKGGE